MKNFFLFLLIFVGTMMFPAADLFSQPDSDPEPFGGNQLMRDFICDEMNYPEEAISKKIEGTVEVAFTVLTDGKKVNYRVLESVSPELDEEALRICRLIMFHPAVKASNNIIANVVVPVKFNIKKYKRHCKQKGFEGFVAYEGTIDTSMIVYPSMALDKMPEPVFDEPGMTFSRFIIDNLKYPELAFRQNIAGEVVLNFVVETSGRISNIEIEEPLGGGCTEEAIQLIKQIRWKPGIKNKMAVRSFMTASISFSLDNNTEHKYLPNQNNRTM